jgi:hypothetical protein
MLPVNHPHQVLPLPTAPLQHPANNPRHPNNRRLPLNHLQFHNHRQPVTHFPNPIASLLIRVHYKTTPPTPGCAKIFLEILSHTHQEFQSISSASGCTTTPKNHTAYKNFIVHLYKSYNNF